MSLLTLKDVALSRGTPLFSNLNLSLAKGDRLGLVAANGRGKTSLLHLLAGDDGPSRGDITTARGLIIALAPQEPPAHLLPMTLHAAVAAALDPAVVDYEGWRVDVMLDDLQIDPALRLRKISELSGGWQRAMLLARAAIIEPDLLLLDEPTNHLDFGRIGILQNFINALPRSTALVTTSHDRDFLDAVTNRTLFLRADDSMDFALPYTAALQALDTHDLARGRQFDNDMRKVRALRQQAAKLKNIGINAGSDLLVVKTKQLNARAEALESRARPAHQDRSAGAIRLSNSGTHAKTLITINDTMIRTPDDRLLLRTGQIWIENGDRIALLGRNGTGKTRLVTRIRAGLAGEDAAIRGAASLRLGYSDQMLSQLDSHRTPWEAVKAGSDISDHNARAQLINAGINLDLQTGPLDALSGGQKARLAMLLLRLLQPNFYLLDEPTNHLDIEGQEALAAELLDQQAACLLVSHDRAFIRAVATRFWFISDRKLIEVDDPEPVFNVLMRTG
ncbi:ATP-binding cassette domain-containing protein [Ketogulonicigenium vulgare]|uniref:ABC transporter, nucleotide binding/ATPase protein n=1 Tax=Ketogulonicigenium vulgare (strain WSH-001) TaxID=759362 RepID=F9YBA8_KETVW|nr:ABC-F family ATP-binding cassette domain-containing protein [Ketogulonicigenium vulgare]ADO44136.1 ABC transporter related protein [Ketogulonicigenium vulgare Y25]AEM42660.1 ABC transporter, nucleotide binding/ATPase protein [Ketogulonicigenium vulgare WSH-001]ALJ82465.1 ABC transporter [Ketogulonicigenium vulgare]ANW35250.1 ABC transporter [Ketogulonicigenium vulgare]AOZ53362.1 ABC transporter related protein [Ketogulonicigenium vulgare]